MSVVSSTWEHIPDVVKGSNIGYVDKLRKGRNFSSALIESFMTHKHQLEPAVTWLIPQKIPRRFRIIKKMVLIKYKFWCRSIVTKWMQSIAGKQKVSELWRSVVLTKLRQIKNVIHVHHRKKKNMGICSLMILDCCALAIFFQVSHCTHFLGRYTLISINTKICLIYRGKILLLFYDDLS